jgi:leader peptidase (prepilin peptidase) / N-methyltransferase
VILEVGIVPCAVLGLLVGSFLNVVIWRVPRGESVVRPVSHCPGCSAPVRPRDNVPVLSWLLLRARCRTCGVQISGRYPLVEFGTGVVFAVLTARLGPAWALPAFLYIAAVGIALAVIDWDTRRLPNALTLPSYAVGIALLAGAAAIDGSWSMLLRAALGMVALFGLYFALAFVYPAGMGFGDVKLAGLLGLYLGWLGWGTWCVGAFAGFLLGAIGGGVVIATRRGGRKTAIPFGPFMLAGALVAILAGAPLVSAYLSLLGV